MQISAQPVASTVDPLKVWPVLIVVVGLIGTFYVLFYRVMLLETVMAKYDDKQQEISLSLVRIETQLDTNNQDLKDIKSDVKSLNSRK